MGGWGLFICYALCGILANVASIVFLPSSTLGLGASGAVFGLFTIAVGIRGRRGAGFGRGNWSRGEAGRETRKQDETLGNHAEEEREEKEGGEGMGKGWGGRRVAVRLSIREFSWRSTIEAIVFGEYVRRMTGACNQTSSRRISFLTRCHGAGVGETQDGSCDHGQGRDCRG
eukprot:766343-Hanusia_phi.AAC.2